MLRLDHSILRKLIGKSAHTSLRFFSSLSEIFHENTKLTPLSSRAYTLSVANVVRSPTAEQLMSQPYKVYSLMDQVELKPLEPHNEIERIITERRSERSFTGEAISQDELGKLLFYSYGRTDLRGRYRAVASGGALYPLEIYVVPNNISGLDQGVYHYNIERHALDVVERGDCWSTLKECVWLQDIEDPDAISMVIVITAIFGRNTMKYDDRGYRLILMETGEVGQNLSLVATSLGLGVCLLGGFIDDALSDLLGIDGIDEAPLLPIVVGKKAGNHPAGTNSAKRA